MNKIRALVLAAACLPCIEWARLAGQVKSINLKDSTITIQSRDGDLFTVPVDYQLKIADKHGEPLDLKRLALDMRVTVTRTLMDKPKEDTQDMAQPEPSPRGRE